MTKAASTTDVPQTAPPLALDPTLIKEIAIAVALALKENGGQQFTMEELGQTIGNSVADGIAKTTRRKVSFGEYTQTGHSPFHPKPLHETPRLRRKCWQNGVWSNPTTLFDEEIELLNSITHGGRYIDRLVEVVIWNEGTTSEEIDVRFPNKDINDQLMMKSHCKDYTDMLRQIKAEQDVERAERAAEEEAKRKRPRQTPRAPQTELE